MTASPIFITSPVVGCGASLLQRLFASSENGICYGEVAGGRISEICSFAHREMVAIQENEVRQGQDWTEAFNGNVDSWLDSLDLPGDFGRHALAGAVQFYKQHYDEATRVIEMEVWGVKKSGMEFTQVTRIVDLINDLKCLFIYRNVFDALKEQKAKGLITDKRQLLQAAAGWVKNTDVIAALKRKNFENLPAMLHVVEYDDLLANLQQNIDGLETFCGIRGVKAEVANLDTDLAPDTAGTALTDEERQAIETICHNRMRELYPDFGTLH